MQFHPGIMMYIQCTNDYHSLCDVESILKGITREYKTNYMFFVSGTRDFISTRCFKLYMLNKHEQLEQHSYKLENKEQRLHAFNTIRREIELDRKYFLNGFDNMSLPPCFVLAPSYEERPVYVSDGNVASLQVNLDTTLTRFPMDITYCFHNDLPLNFSPINTEKYDEHMRITCIRVMDRLISTSIFAIHSVNDCIRNRLEHIPCISS